MKPYVMNEVKNILRDKSERMTGKEIRQELNRRVNKKDLPRPSELGYAMARSSSFMKDGRHNNAVRWVLSNSDEPVNPFAPITTMLQNTPAKDFLKEDPRPRPIHGADNANNIAEVFHRVRDLVLQKNLQYGDSVLNPLRVFSDASPKEQLLVRIDDKLSRLSRGDDSMESDIDTYEDLMGYLALLIVFLEREQNGS